MRKVFETFIELIFCLAIFCFALFTKPGNRAIVYFSNEKLLWLSIFISSIGFLSGIFIAEKIRRKQGCSNFVSKLF